MSEWKEKSLAEIAADKPYSIVDGPFGTQLHASEYQEEGVPVVRVINTTYEGRFDDKDLVYISETKANSLKRSELVPGDVIVAKTGATIGKSGIFPSRFPKGIVASSCLKISVDPKKADNRFVARLIESHEGQRKIIDGAGGSTRTTINIKPFSAIRFTFPDDTDEQAQIASILSIIDRAIEQTESIIEKQTRIKTGLMQALLTRGIDNNGNIRSEETNEFKDSPLGKIPVEWDCKTAEQLLKEGILGEIQDGNHGELHPKSNDFVEDGIPFIMAADIATGAVDFDGCKKITEKKYRSLRIGFAKSKDVLLSHKASIGFVAIVPDNVEQLMLTPQVTYYRIKNSEKLLNSFLYYFMQSSRFQNPIKNLAKQSTRDYIGILAQHNLYHIFPKELSEQRRIIETLQTVDEAIGNVANELGKLKRLKLGLMQDLLIGRVPVAELMKKREIQQVVQ